MALAAPILGVIGNADENEVALGGVGSLSSKLGG
jgi:hypothetical protein